MASETDASQRLSRRAFLERSLGGIALLSAPAAALAIPSHGNSRTLSFYHEHTGEHLALTYWSNGHYRPGALQSVRHFLRDHRTDQIHEIDARLLDVLYLVQRGLGFQRSYHVISGYRSPATNELLRKMGRGVARKSMHMEGKAVDVFVPGVRLGGLQQAALELKAGGVGYYPRSGFVHLDVGPVRRW